MTHATCRLTAKNRDQLDPMLSNRVWATFTFFHGCDQQRRTDHTASSVAIGHVFKLGMWCGLITTKVNLAGMQSSISLWLSTARKNWKGWGRNGIKCGCDGAWYTGDPSELASECKCLCWLRSLQTIPEIWHDFNICQEGLASFQALVCLCHLSSVCSLAAASGCHMGLFCCVTSGLL